MAKTEYPHFSNCADFEDKIEHQTPFTDSNSRTKYLYVNEKRSRLSKYRVDGCLIKETSEKKCDFLLLNLDLKKSFFIELKGSDLIQAIRQIDNSISILKRSIEGYSIHARIVLTRVNTIDLRHSEFVRFNKKICRLGGTIIKCSRILEEVEK